MDDKAIQIKNMKTLEKSMKKFTRRKRRDRYAQVSTQPIKIKEQKDVSFLSVMSIKKQNKTIKKGKKNQI